MFQAKPQRQRQHLALPVEVSLHHWTYQLPTQLLSGPVLRAKVSSRSSLAAIVKPVAWAGRLTAAWSALGSLPKQPVSIALMPICFPVGFNMISYFLSILLFYSLAFLLTYHRHRKHRWRSLQEHRHPNQRIHRRNRQQPNSRKLSVAGH